MFQSRSLYTWKHPPHVIVFANQPSQSNALSADRLVLLEILNEDYDYAIRHAKCEVKVIQRTKKFVSFLTSIFVACWVTYLNVRKLTKAKHFIFTDEEIALEQVKHKDTEHPNCSVSSYMGLSEIIYSNDGAIPQNVMALVMDLDERD